MNDNAISDIEPYLMVVLAKRFESIARQMTNTLLRAARSVVINTAHDFSCSIADSNAQLLCLGAGLPIHLASSGLAAGIITELFDDIRPGDCFLNNSPYHGNTHHADHTVCVPVFYRGEHLFTTLARSHQADCGNSQPTTYMPFSQDIYAEGALNFPCVRVQREYEDISDVLRMARMRIRVPDLWYGDFLAAVGACRIGERELIALCDKYGPKTIKTFVSQWHDYGRRRMKDAIGRLPKGTWNHETRLDPFPFVADDGLCIRLKMTVNPEEGIITLDFTESDDRVPGGLNMSRATVMAAGITGVLNNLDPTLPNNDGAFEQIWFVMREGSVVGPAKHPFCSSMATTTVADRVVNVVQSCFAKLDAGMGMAEGALGMPASSAVISGTDPRKDDEPYVNHMLIGGAGGPAVYGYDGYLAYGIPVCGGVVHSDSVEVAEQRFPILFSKNEIITDSGGPGRWRGAPGVECRVRERFGPGTWAYAIDGHYNPAAGVAGGRSGRRQDVWKYRMDDLEQTRIEMPKVSQEVMMPEEVLVSESGGGGGFGDPLERYPERVGSDVHREYVSVKAAREIYGVVIDTALESPAVDLPATEKLRREMRGTEHEL